MNIKYAAQAGRFGDDMLVHMSRDEVAGLASLVPGGITRNPETGLPEFFKLGDILPAVIGIAGTAMGLPTWATALGAGVGTAITSGDLGKGVMSGLLSYGLGNIFGDVGGAGQAAEGIKAVEAASNTASAASAFPGATPMDVDDAFLGAMATNPTPQLAPHDAFMQGLQQPGALTGSLKDNWMKTSLPAGVGLLGLMSPGGQTGYGNLQNKGLPGSSGPINIKGPWKPQTQFPQRPDLRGREYDYFPAFAEGGRVRPDWGPSNRIEAKALRPGKDGTRVRFDIHDERGITADRVSPPMSDPRALDLEESFHKRKYMAKGGIASLPRKVRGPGDGQSDSVPAMIAGRQPAALSDGEFVVPADVVAHMGNGSTDAGAQRLYEMMNRVRQARTGKKSQPRPINPMKMMPA